MDGAVEKYFQKGENAASRFPRAKVVDVFRREDGGRRRRRGAKRSMFRVVGGTTAALTARLKVHGIMLRWESERQTC